MVISVTMAAPERLDVMIVPFPFVDLPVSKKRPAVVLSHQAFNAATGTAIFAMITSAEDSEWAEDVTVSDLRAAGLQSDCKIRMKIFTLDLGLVVGHAGRLSAQDAKAMQSALDRVIAP